MGILNITPDSFSDGGEFNNHEKAFKKAIEMHQEGAAIIDIGGESTRPGASEVSEEEELARILPVIERIKKYDKSIIISADTRKSSVAEEALNAGADIINDVSGARFDQGMISVIHRYNPAYVLMHSSDNPDKMQDNPVNENNIMDVLSEFFQERLHYFEINDINTNNIIIDPGIGFGKTPRANHAIIKSLHMLKRFEKPILIGTSRKSFIGRMDNSDVRNRLGGSIASAILSMLNGADIIRCHDVFETNQAVSTFRKIEEYEQG